MGHLVANLRLGIFILDVAWLSSSSRDGHIYIRGQGVLCVSSTFWSGIFSGLEVWRALCELGF